MSALVIGTMTPDFSYLLRLTPGGSAWHTKAGLLEYCLPAGLAAWWIFRTLIGPALLRLLPPGLGDALGSRVAPGPAYRLIPAVIAAILAGVISHDLWDSFTHQGAWGVRMFPALRLAIPFSATEWVRWYLILQYVSSAIGLVVVGAIVWRWVASQPKSARHVPVGARAWRARDAALLVSSGALGAVMNVSRAHPSGPSSTLGFAAVGAMAAFALALLAYGIVDSIRHRDADNGDAARTRGCADAPTMLAS